MGELRWLQGGTGPAQPAIKQVPTKEEQLLALRHQRRAMVDWWDSAIKVMDDQIALLEEKDEDARRIDFHD